MNQLPGKTLHLYLHILRSGELVPVVDDEEED